jgi:toxin ParE1/3/4
MRILWSPEAIEDLSALRNYIAKDDADAARRVALAIAKHIDDVLAGHPESGRAGRVPGTRELVIPRTPYLVPYRVTGDALIVLRVFHGRRRWPKTL